MNFRELFEKTDDKKFTNGIKNCAKKAGYSIESIRPGYATVKGFSKDVDTYEEESRKFTDVLDNQFGSYMDKFYIDDSMQKKGWVIIIDEN